MCLRPCPGASTCVWPRREAAAPGVLERGAHARRAPRENLSFEVGLPSFPRPRPQLVVRLHDR